MTAVSSTFATPAPTVHGHVTENGGLPQRRPHRFGRMSERPFPTPVALRDRASGRYLATGATWTDDAGDAVVVDRVEAERIVVRFSCEPDAVEVVPAPQRAVA
jgi:hypothetical protein